MPFMSLNMDSREATKFFQRFPRETTRAFTSALLIEAEEIIGDAKEETPVDEGTLRDSGFVDSPQLLGSEVQVEAGFGGPASDYAWVQHERTDFKHTTGKAKYLEDPFNRHLAGMDTRLARNVRSQLNL